MEKRDDDSSCRGVEEKLRLEERDGGEEMKGGAVAPEGKRKFTG
jgi:hypothetical protein